MNKMLNEIEDCFIEYKNLILENISSYKSEKSEKEYQLALLKEKLNLVEENNDKHFSPTKMIKEKNNIEILNNMSKVEEEIDLIQKRMDQNNFKIDLIEHIDRNSRHYFKEDATENLGIKILETQEIERKRIARELHDSTVQNLTTLVHKSEFCMKLVDKDPIRVKLELETMASTIRNTINDMRDIINDMRPMLLDDFGLIVAVQRLLNGIKENNDISIVFDRKNVNKDIHHVVSTALFRIIQEACNNSIKHANAKNIFVYVEYTDEEIIVKLKDDGIGFKYDNDETDDYNISESKFGLSIMRERVYLLQGNIEILSSKEEGTTINVRVPLIINDGGNQDANKNYNS